MTNYAAIYSTVYAARPYGAGTGQHAAALLRACSRLTPPRSVLDVGCGQGWLVRWWLARGVPARGCDVVRAPGWDPPEAFAVADARALPEADKGVELVCVCDVLEHLDEADAVAALREAARVGERVLVQVCCRRALTVIPGLGPLHRTVRTPDWWAGVMRGIGLAAERRPEAADPFAIFTAMEAPR